MDGIMSRFPILRRTATLRTPRILFHNLLFCVAFSLVLSFTLSAHAILIKSIPTANQVVNGPTVALALTFNSRIDQARSTLILESSDHTSSKIPVKVDSSSPEKLMTTIPHLAAGSYRLRWQVLAVDGHITRGELPFQVK